MFSSHPELLSLLPFTESLEDNEAISASGLANYSIIHDDPPAVGGGGGGSGRDVEGNKAVSHPGARQTHNNNNSNSSSNGPTSSSSAISNSPLQQQVEYIFPFFSHSLDFCAQSSKTKDFHCFRPFLA